MKNVERELPRSWVWTTLGEATHVNRRNRAVRAFPDTYKVTFVPMAAVDADAGIITSPEERTLGQVRKGFTPFVDHDVIMAKITPSMENGKAAIARGLVNGIGFGSTEFHVFTPTNVVVPEYVFHFIRQESFRRDAKANFAGTAGQLRVPSSFLENYPFPLAPLPEQRRIVAKIEELFSHLDAGVAVLKRVQAALKRYKASVLKAACEGRLVPQDPSDEPADELLARILNSIGTSGGSETRTKQKTPNNLGGHNAPSQPVVWPTPPTGWTLVSVEQICARIVDCLHSTPAFRTNGYYCLDSNWIKPGVIDKEKARYVDQQTFFDRNRRMQPQEHDVAFSREGALLGVAVRIPPNFDCCLGQRMMIFRPNSSITGAYLEAVLNSEVFISQYKPKVTGTAAPHLNIGTIRGLSIPLPPIAEQDRIVAEVERSFSVIRELEKVVGASLIRANRLRQSILAQAFCGRLVPQDPSDAAGRLIEEIRAGRTDALEAKAAKPGRRKARATA